MKTLILCSLITLLSFPALASHDSWYDEAKVIKVTPVYKNTAQHYNHSSNSQPHYSAELKHNNIKVRVKHNGRHESHHHNKPKHYYRHNELAGFNVTYKYKGNVFHTFTEEHPGHRITVKLNIAPVYHNRRNKMGHHYPK